MREPTPLTIFLKDYTPPAFLVSTVDLHVDIRADHALVRAQLALSRNPAATDPRAPLVLNGDELELLSVAIDGRQLGDGQYSVDAEHLTISDTPERCTLETCVRIKPQQNTKLEGLYATKSGFSRNAKPRVFAASPISSTAPM